MRTVVAGGHAEDDAGREAVLRALRAGAALLCCLSAPLGAQERAAESPPWSIAPYFGLAQNSPRGTEWGWYQDRDHVMAGVHLDAPVLRVGPLRLLYSPNVTGFVRVTHRPNRATEVKQPTAVGAGIAPLGIGLRLPLGTRADAVGRLAVGGLWFDRVLPTPDAREFNFTLEMGGSIAIKLRPGSAVEIGYKFHHLSNLYTRPENGGVDADLFYVGWRRDGSARGTATR